mgnify:CR=1 FL=1
MRACDARSVAPQIGANVGGGPDLVAQHLAGETGAQMLDAIASPLGLRPEDTIFGLVERTRWLDARWMAALDGGIRQFVILGAGLDARAWRLPRLSTTCRVFELDVPAAIAYKEAAVAREARAGAPKRQAVAERRAAELRRVADAALMEARKASLGATKRLVVEPVSVDRAARRQAIENLDRLARAAKSTPDGAERVVDQATKAGVRDDAPELLRGRQLMHLLKLDEARAIVKEATSVIPEYKARFDELTSQGCNRAAFGWKRKLDESLSKQTEATSNILFHERRAQQDAELLEACLAARRAAGRPASSLEDASEDEVEVVEENDDAAAARRAVRRAVRAARARAELDKAVAEKAIRDARRRAAAARYEASEAAAASSIAAHARSMKAKRDRARRRHVMRERDAMKTKREAADALERVRAAAAREASHIKKQRSRRAVAAFVRPRYEYAINEDARRAQLAADVAAAELEKLRCRRDADRAAADAAALAAQQDAFLSGKAPRPVFDSSLDTMEAPLDPLLKFGGRPPPPPAKPVAPHPPPDIREEVPLSTTEAARLRINRALARVMRRNFPTRLRLHYVDEEKERSLSLVLPLPAAWRARPAAKLVATFNALYAKKRGALLRGAALRDLRGNDLGERTILEAARCGELRVCC